MASTATWEQTPGQPLRVALNRFRAVQPCVDIGAHLITSLELPQPGTLGETLGRLAEGLRLPESAQSNRSFSRVIRSIRSWSIARITAGPSVCGRQKM